MSDLPLKDGQEAKFELGCLVGTPGSAAALYAAKVDPLDLVARHATGDWGDLCLDDKLANEDAVHRGGRLLSRYTLSTDEVVYVITEGDRSVTTLLLPSEY